MGKGESVNLLPDSHTEFVLSVKWEDKAWAFILIALACVVGLTAILVYCRRRRK